MLLLVSSCKPKQAETEREVLARPRILLDGDVPYAEFTLGGIKISDPESKIDPALVRKTSEASDHKFVHCTNGTQYKVVGGKVVSLQLTDPAKLAAIGVADVNAMKSALGQPDAERLQGTTFDYTQRHQTWSWGAAGLDMVSVKQ